MTDDTPIELSTRKVRTLTAQELGMIPNTSEEHETYSSNIALEPLPDDDPILQQVVELSSDYGGVIFQGPPGTGKSWYAARVAVTLANTKSANWRLVQFHPSYQYEDFMEGFVPDATTNTFTLMPKHFLELCKHSRAVSPETVILVIDELSRGDPGRVFGEALTYIERTKRDLPFYLASGTECTVPSNLLILATMNPMDRGVDEVDAALQRRFAKIGFDPDEAAVERFLLQAGMSEQLRRRVLTFFRETNRRSTQKPLATLGHTYFRNIGSIDDLRRLWDHQLRFMFDSAYRLNPDELADIYADWERVITQEPSGALPSDASSPTDS